MAALRASKLVCFSATANPGAAKEFYGAALGLRLVEDSPFALVFDVAGTTLRVQKVQRVVPAPYTALGWEVRGLEGVVRELTAKGVTFQRYDGLEQNPEGIWESPGGARVAWFRDPDGNTLSLTELP